MSVFTVESLADGVSGAAGGISAISVFYPLNIIRTKLQTDDPAKKERSIREVLEEILRDDGVGGLFKGWWGQVIALGCSNFVYFYAYQVLKAKIQRATRARITPGIS